MKKYLFKLFFVLLPFIVILMTGCAMVIGKSCDNQNEYYANREAEYIKKLKDAGFNNFALTISLRPSSLLLEETPRWDASLSFSDQDIANLESLNGLEITELWLNGTQVSDLSPLEGMPLNVLYLNNTLVSDLSALNGMPLHTLFLSDTQVSDLSPLEGMLLNTLDIGGTQVSDLSPLEGMPLNVLYLNNTLVSDLSVLNGMPLSSLDISGTQVSDLSPLEDAPLKLLRFEPVGITNGIDIIPVGCETIQRLPEAEK